MLKLNKNQKKIYNLSFKQLKSRKKPKNKKKIKKMSKGMTLFTLKT